MSHNDERSPAAGQPRALVLTADRFEDMEVHVPVLRLIELGWWVDVAAPTMAEMHGENGYPLYPDLTFDQADSSAYDLLLVPGGAPDGAPAVVRDLPRAQTIARDFMLSDRPVASICHGPWLLAAAGTIGRRRLTSYWHDGVPESIRAAGGNWVDAEVVVDGNLVTSRWPNDLAAFNRELTRLARSVPAPA